MSYNEWTEQMERETDSRGHEVHWSCKDTKGECKKCGIKSDNIHAWDKSCIPKEVED